MSDFNKVIIMGRLTQKPELRFTPGEAAVANLNVASSSKFKNKAGEEKEETCFIDVIVWGRQAETCTEYLVKGQSVLVEGRLVLRKWESQTGEKRRTYEIKAQNVQFLAKPKGKGADAPALDDSEVPRQDDEEEDKA